MPKVKRPKFTKEQKATNWEKYLRRADFNYAKLLLDSIIYEKFTTVN